MLMVVVTTVVTVVVIALLAVGIYLNAAGTDWGIGSGFLDSSGYIKSLHFDSPFAIGKFVFDFSSEFLIMVILIGT